jgi:tetratricopeptide (TPR) repeat protein
MGVLETVATRARDEGQPRIEGEARRHLASAYSYREQYARAIDELQRARTLYATAGDRSLEARCVMEMAEVHRTQGKPAEAMALARSAMAVFREVHDEQGVVDAAEVLVYLMPESEDHSPIRNEALAVVDADGKPLACGVLHEWADGLFARGLGGEAFTKISELGMLPPCRRARPRSAVAREPRRVHRLHGRLGRLAQCRRRLLRLAGSTVPSARSRR